MFSPISYQFIAAGAATQAKGLLYRMKPSRNGQGPSWEGKGENLTTNEMTSPITDKSFWEGRYALCELTLENDSGERLVINDAVVGLSQAKNIVTTQIVGMKGSVKEYVNEGDYSLNIVVGIVAVRDGKIVDDYPEDGLRELRSFLKEETALSIHSEFLDIFDINKIVVKSFSVVQATESNYQSVSISAISDEEYNIYSTDY